nr:MAG TPA: hypothetical protein [Caudoviricetes sp.]
MLFFRSSSVIRNKNLNWVLCISFECGFLFILKVRISPFEIFNCCPSVAFYSCVNKCLFTSDFWENLCSIYSADKIFLHFLSKIVRKLPLRVNPIVISLPANSCISTGISITSSTAKSLLEFSDNLLSEFARTPTFIFLFSFLVFYCFLPCFTCGGQVFCLLRHDLQVFLIKNLLGYIQRNSLQ